MHTVNIGIGHDYYLAVAELLNVEVLADTRSESRYHGLQLIVAVDTVDTGLFNVEHLSPQRKYSLITPVASLLCGTARRISLDNVYFRISRVALGAVGKLFGH